VTFRGICQKARGSASRAVWLLTVGGVDLRMWSFYLLVTHAYAG
jgi:hypothetical protein